jgi:hypothetical protein
LRDLKYEIPEEKVARIRGAVRALCEVNSAPTPKVASAYGQLAACKLACGPPLSESWRVSASGTTR